MTGSQILFIIVLLVVIYNITPNTKSYLGEQRRKELRKATESPSTFRRWEKKNR